MFSVKGGTGTLANGHGSQSPGRGSGFGAAIQDISLYLEARGGCQVGHAHVSEVMADQLWFPTVASGWL
ncbi:hypothetical protein LUU34_00922400 [Aix galericulata]|nr:hypothetical protein LUU34_00922400 [Aix galericulata]